MKQRNHAFDLLCGLCILRMILLHIMQFTGQAQTDWWNIVMEWSFFFMSFFFFKAGYFNKGVSSPTLPYLKDRVKRLLVPYLTCGLIGDAVYFAFVPFLINRYHKPVEPLEWSHIWDNSSFYGNAPTWFLFSFFVAYIAVHFIEKVRGLHWIVLGFPLVSYWFWTLDNPLWMKVDNVFIGIFFFYLGRLLHLLIDKTGERFVLGCSILMVIGFITGNIFWHGEYTMSSNRFTGDFLPTMVNTVLALCGWAGLLLTIRIPRIPVLCFIGEHSMVFFLCHYPMLYFYKFMHLSFGRSIFGHLDDTLILIPVIFALCTWLVPYFEAVPWLSGRWKEKEEHIPYEPSNATI